MKNIYKSDAFRDNPLKASLFGVLRKMFSYANTPLKLCIWFPLFHYCSYRAQAASYAVLMALEMSAALSAQSPTRTTGMPAFSSADASNAAGRAPTAITT